jgi:hypothetical protein
MLVQEGILVLNGNRGNPIRGGSNLPAGLYREICDPHPIWGAPWAWRNTFVRSEVLITSAGTACELNDETLSHEVGTI